MVEKRKTSSPLFSIQKLNRTRRIDRAKEVNVDPPGPGIGKYRTPDTVEMAITIREDESSGPSTAPAGVGARIQLKVRSRDR